MGQNIKPYVRPIKAEEDGSSRQTCERTENDLCDNIFQL